MNKHQVMGAVKEATGKVQQKFGAVIGSERQHERGLKKEVEGRAEKEAGDAEEALKVPHRYP